MNTALRLPFDIIVADFEIAKSYAAWGTYGPSGKEELKYVRLIDCSSEHLLAIYKTQPIGDTYQAIIKAILKDRLIYV